MLFVNKKIFIIIFRILAILLIIKFFLILKKKNKNLSKVFIKNSDPIYKYSIFFLESNYLRKFLTQKKCALLNLQQRQILKH